MKRVVLAVVFGLFLSLSIVSAADFGYTITSFSTDMTITPDGRYEIEEDIQMFFSKPLHGFYRDIPTRYDFEDPQKPDIRARVSKIRANEELSINSNSDYLSIRIGDPDRTVTGLREYRLSYHYNIGNDLNETYDEFYFNLVGEYWQVPLENVTFSITFPKPVEASAVWFTKGLYGSTSSQGVRWNLSGDGLRLTGSVDQLYPGEALTVRVQMPDGYFDRQADYQAVVAKFNLWVYLLAVALAVFLWITFGRDEDLIIVPQFSPPTGMSPMDIGYLIDESLDPRDITSMIFYWADKGCLSIVEDDGKFSFIKGKDPVEASLHEQHLFNAFFKEAKNGVLKMSDLQGKFFQEYQKMVSMVAKHYRGKRALSNPVSRNMAIISMLAVLVPAIGFALALTLNFVNVITVVALLAIIGFAAVFAVLVHLMMRKWHIRNGAGKIFWVLWLILAAFVSTLFLSIFGLVSYNDFSFSLVEAAKATAATAVIVFLAVNTRKRSAFGKQSIEAVLGYRDFIDKVEIEKLKRMIDEDPEYYYHVLAFAIVLGLEKKWARKFDGITMEPPQWYMGRYDMWNVVVLSSMLSRCNAALISSMTTVPKSSPGMRFGGSSFGGGGFSGGGFGGGGGGAW